MLKALSSFLLIAEAQDTKIPFITLNFSLNDSQSYSKSKSHFLVFFQNLPRTLSIS